MVAPGSATRPFAGIGAEIRNERGDTVGGGGLLALTRPWPAMLRGIYGDPDRYVKQYWNPWCSGVYVTGDPATRDQYGYFWLLGRVDDVINAAVGRWPRARDLKGQAIAAFVTLKDGVSDGAHSTKTSPTF